MARATRPTKKRQAEDYRHPNSESPMRPDVGTQAQFKKRKPPQKYRYDDSLSPALDWDGQNSAREKGEAAIREIIDAKSLEEAKRAAEKLKALSKPFLNWAGKAERLSFDVPTLPLFVHERLSTKAIIQTLTGHKRDKQTDMYSLFGDPQHSVTDQVLRAYEHRDQWVNRMMLGDSLAVMNSLLHYEGLGGQVQMIYMDPPYGVKFGSNFQPFVRKRDVSHNDDEDMTREPEMVQAYRDTWELGLHSYLTYLRDRLLLARDLLAPSGSIFVQISDENVHHIRELMDEVFGADNFIVTIVLKKKGNQKGDTLEPINDYLICFAKEKERVKIRPVFTDKLDTGSVMSYYNKVEMPDGSIHNLSEYEKEDLDEIHALGGRIFTADQLTSGGEFRTQIYEVVIDSQSFRPAANNSWKINEDAMHRLMAAGRVLRGRDQIRFKKYLSDFPCTALTNFWDDLGGATDKIYVVQTALKAVQRCILIATDPGDLVLDPTCGSGTTAYVAEQWGRRWITMDTSRVPLALARQRLLTATFPWYELNDNARGPAGGFKYQRKQNNKGEHVGGIVPHVTLESIANNEPPKEEVLVDRPERDSKITRVTGAFCLEGTISTPVDAFVGAGLAPPSGGDERFQMQDLREDQTTFTDRMLEILRKSPVLRLDGNKTLALKNIRPPAKTLSLSAEAMVDATANGQSPTLADAVQEAAEKSGKVLPLSARPVALVFGPENGAVGESLVYNAAKEAYAKSYSHLYVIGFAIQPNARELIEKCGQVMGIPATYIQATPDLMMGDLLKNMRSSQIFSVCGLPEIKIHHRDHGEHREYQVELLGLDVFDPITMEVQHRNGDDVPAWFLDTDYNGLCFHVSQAFFPRTSAWDNLKRALKSEYEESVWDHLAGAKSAPFEAGEHKQIAVKVIDDRGNELMVVNSLTEAV